MKAEVRSGSIIGIGAFKFGTLLPVQMADGRGLQSSKFMMLIASLTATGEQTNWELEPGVELLPASSFSGCWQKWFMVYGLWLQD